MGWSISELKSRGKTAFKANYWKCVLVAFILAVAAGNNNNSNSSSPKQVSEQIESIKDQGFDNSFDLFDDAISDDALDLGMQIGMGVVSVVVVLVAIIVGAIVLLLNVFVFNPLEVGCRRFFIENSRNNYSTGIGLVGSAFKDGNYGTVVVTMVLRELYIFLWSLLLLIPGIVKAYEYRMIPYLLADNPYMTREEAFRLSKQMMDGQKWNAFVLDLSFIGWRILAAFTFGILNVFYVSPYVQATDAELYATLKRY